jgi:UDP-2,3-diacylglucosamine pyrophosphatase LpxH
MRLIADTFPKKVYPIGDMHIGSNEYLPELLKEKLKEIKYNDGYIVGMGDYCEIGTKHSYGTFNQVIFSTTQYKELLKYLKSFKKKIIGLYRGNHEERIKRDTGFDIVSILASNLRCKYFGIVKPFRKFGKIFYGAHPKRSATVDSGRRLMFDKMLRIQEADIYLAGHCHSLYSRKIRRLYYTNRRIEKDIWFIMTGSFLKYEGSYAEEKLYEPQGVGCQEISIYKDGLVEVNEL